MLTAVFMSLFMSSAYAHPPQVHHPTTHRRAHQPRHSVTHIYMANHGWVHRHSVRWISGRYLGKGPQRRWVPGHFIHRTPHHRR